MVAMWNAVETNFSHPLLGFDRKLQPLMGEPSQIVKSGVFQRSDVPVDPC